MKIRQLILVMVCLMFGVCISIVLLSIEPCNSFLPHQAASLVYVKEHSGTTAVVNLPTEMSKMSYDGNVYVTSVKSLNFYLWQTIVGKAGNFHGVVFFEGTKADLVHPVELLAPGANGLEKWRIAKWVDADHDHWAFVSTDFSD